MLLFLKTHYQLLLNTIILRISVSAYQFINCLLCLIDLLFSFLLKPHPSPPESLRRQTIQPVHQRIYLRSVVENTVFSRSASAFSARNGWQFLLVVQRQFHFCFLNSASSSARERVPPEFCAGFG